MTKDMTAPNWARTVARLRRNMDELRALGVRTIEPPDFDIPPSRRRPLASGGPVLRGVAVILGDQGPETLVDWTGSPISPRRSGDHGLS
jgi:hypothetical protein